MDVTANGVMLRDWYNRAKRDPTARVPERTRSLIGATEEVRRIFQCWAPRRTGPRARCVTWAAVMTRISPSNRIWR